MDSHNTESEVDQQTTTEATSSDSKEKRSDEASDSENENHVDAAATIGGSPQRSLSSSSDDESLYEEDDAIVNQGIDENLEYNFRMKICMHFIPNSRKEGFCQCNRTLDGHPKNEPEFVREPEAKGLIWDSKMHTKEVPTDAKGEIEFWRRYESDRKYKGQRQEYVRLSDRSSLIKLTLYIMEKWGEHLEGTKLIISVIGSTEKPDTATAKQFSRCLLRCAKHSKAWIIASATDPELLQLLSDEHKQVVIGIAHWGSLKGKSQLQQLKKDPVQYKIDDDDNGHDSLTLKNLQPKHTFYILVDDGSEKESANVVHFRCMLERIFNGTLKNDDDDRDNQKGFAVKTPDGNFLVTVLLGGGPESVRDVYRRVQMEMYVIIVAPTGGASSVISIAKELSKEGSKNNKMDENVLNSDGWKTNVEQSLCFFFNWDKIKDKDKLAEHLKYLKLICNAENENFVHLLPKEELDYNSFDKAILNVITSNTVPNELFAQTSFQEIQLKLCVKLNTFDVAERYFSDTKCLHKPQFLDDLFKTCLSENKPELVKLILQAGANIDRAFEESSAIEAHFKKTLGGASVKLKTGHLEFKSDEPTLLGDCETPNNGHTEINSDKGLTIFLITDTIKKLIGGEFEWEWAKKGGVAKKNSLNNLETDVEQLENQNEGTVVLEIHNPSFLLFAWAVIKNYQEMAKVLWEDGDNYMAKALIAVILYRRLRSKSKSKIDHTIEYEKEFEGMATRLLKKCYDADPIETCQLIASELTVSSSHSVLGLAVRAEHEIFVAEKAPQFILDEMWCGGLQPTRNMLAKVTFCLMFPVFALWMFEYKDAVFDEDGLEKKTKDRVFANSQLADDECYFDYFGDSGSHDKEKEGSSESEKLTCCEKLNKFFTAPVTKFCLNTLIFYIFLALYIYFVLGELPDHFPAVEIILASFVLSITTEEIRQVLTETGDLRRKLKHYFKSFWNWLDFIGIVLFWVAFGMRFVENDTVQNVARFIYILDVFFWFMRVLNIFTESEVLGPLVTIIINMIPNLLKFFCIWILFMVAFGTITNAVLYPKRYGQVNIVDIVNIFDKTYWETYGELPLDDFDEHIQDQSCTYDYDDESGLEPCPFLPYASFVFVGAYMIVGNILLINLLIAMFSSLYNSVSSKSDTDWKNKKLALIVEYHSRPPIPPPFAVFYHLFLLTRCEEHRKQVANAQRFILKVNDDRKKQLLSFEESHKLQLFPLKKIKSSREEDNKKNR